MNVRILKQNLSPEVFTIDVYKRQRPAPHSHQAPATIVLPGESLSKYGGTPTGETTPEKPAPPRPNYTFKPSTLIDAPITWDGSGLLPGESISRHRGPQPEVEPDLPSESAPAAEASAATEQAVEEQRQATESSYYETETGTEDQKETALEFEEESLGADAFNEISEEDSPTVSYTHLAANPAGVETSRKPAKTATPPAALNAKAVPTEVAAALPERRPALKPSSGPQPGPVPERNP